VFSGNLSGAITGTQNALPTALGSFGAYNVGSNTVLNGLAGGVTGKIFSIRNESVGGNSLTINHLDVAASAGNRINTGIGEAITLVAGETINFRYLGGQWNVEGNWRSENAILPFQTLVSSYTGGTSTDNIAYLAVSSLETGQLVSEFKISYFETTGTTGGTVYQLLRNGVVVGSVTLAAASKMAEGTITTPFVLALNDVLEIDTAPLPAGDDANGVKNGLSVTLR
jgi:hypothetical protein